MKRVPVWKKCPVCHLTYDWNPDIGVSSCPYCHGQGKGKKGFLGKVFGTDENDNREMKISHNLNRRGKFE